MQQLRTAEAEVAGLQSRVSELALTNVMLRQEVIRWTGHAP
jgi:hypothetical protein